MYSQGKNTRIEQVRPLNTNPLDDRFKKSAFTGWPQNRCVEVRHANASIEVRDTKNPDGAVLSFTADEWIAFTNGVKSGEFELA